MNVVEALAQRCNGFDKVTNYDIALGRLKCRNHDVYRCMHLSATEETSAVNPPIFACSFSSTPGFTRVIAIANEEGQIAIQNTDNIGSSEQRIDGVQAQFNAIFDIAWMPGEMKLVSASGDHTARLWDVSRPNSYNEIAVYSGHTRSVKTVVFRPEDKAIFASGARDGAIMVWDIRASHGSRPKPDNCIMNGHSNGITNSAKPRRSLTLGSRAHSITTLAFQDDQTLISCAAGDGLIKVWDMRKNYTVHKKEPVPKHTMNYAGASIRNGFTATLVSPDRTRLYASCMDSIIYEYNIGTYSPDPVGEFYGHQNTTFYVKTCLSPDGKYLASGSSDEYAYIWSTDRPGGPLAKLTGHTDEVTCLAWSSTCEGEPRIVTCSDDSTHRIWRVGLEHDQENDAFEVRGRAEIVHPIDPIGRKTLETTPTVSRRRLSRNQRTPGSDTHSDTTPNLNRNNVGSLNNGSCSRPASGTKRTSEEMILGGRWTDGKYNSVLSPINENLEPASKRPHLDNRCGARRLFSPGNNKNIPTLDDQHNGYKSDEPRPSTSGTTADRSYQSTFSPTLNLPNYVIDGTAPHLVQMSPQKLKENIDWLTKIRKERYELRIVQASESAKVAISPNTQSMGARRTSRSKSLEPRKVSKFPAVSLLNFFRASSKDTDKDGSSNTQNMSQTTPKTPP